MISVTEGTISKTFISTTTTAPQFIVPIINFSRELLAFKLKIQNGKLSVSEQVALHVKVSQVKESQDSTCTFNL